MPKISVIMPAYNAEKYIREAMDSILNQTFRDLELIIINDCSKDGTESAILTYDDKRIIYAKNEENLGVARTLNRGLALARGEYIARMDADDIAMPERFAQQAAWLDAHPECIVCGSFVERFGAAEGLCRYPETDGAIKTALWFSSPFAHPSVMLRAGVPGLTYEPDYEKVEDYRLWTQLAKQGSFYNIQKPLLRYRIHPEQVCATASEVQHEGRLRLARELLPLKEADIAPVVEAFDGTLQGQEGFQRFADVAVTLAKTGKAPDCDHLKRLLKSRIIELALERKAAIPMKCLPLVGIKAFVYVNLKRI